MSVVSTLGHAADSMLTCLYLHMHHMTSRTGAEQLRRMCSDCLHHYSTIPGTDCCHCFYIIQLADDTQGVIGLKWRQVDCSEVNATPGSPAPASPAPNSPAPDANQDSPTAGNSGQATNQQQPPSEPSAPQDATPADTASQEMPSNYGSNNFDGDQGSVSDIRDAVSGMVGSVAKAFTSHGGPGEMSSGTASAEAYAKAGAFAPNGRHAAANARAGAFASSRGHAAAYAKAGAHARGV